MDNSLALYVIAAIVALLSLLILVISINKGGNEMGIREAYWRAFDLYQEQPATVQQPMLAQAPRGPTPIRPTPQAQRPAPSSGPTKAFIDIPKNRTGYYVECAINGVKFMAAVDTGASHANIDTATAIRVGLVKRRVFGGLQHSLKQDMNFTLADGRISPGRIGPIDWVIGGKLKATGASTSVPLADEGGGALLGLSALNQFDVEIKNNVMRISER